MKDFSARLLERFLGLVLGRSGAEDGRGREEKEVGDHDCDSTAVGRNGRGTIAGRAVVFWSPCNRWVWLSRYQCNPTNAQERMYGSLGIEYAGN